MATALMHNRIFSRGPKLPKFTYDGEYALVEENGGWKSHFLTTGTLVPAEKLIVDIFAVGGGGGGNYYHDTEGGGGGAGGYTQLLSGVTLEAGKDYLPIDFVNYVLELFHNKTAYKNVPGKEDLYKKAKAYINSLYGMCVTALLMSDIVWDDESGTWHIQRITEQKLVEHLGKIAKYSDKRYFLNYDWGVWISNGARCRLWNDLIIPYDNHVIYADTDSIFTDIAIDFTDYNAQLDKRLKKVCDERGLDFEKTRPANPKGERSYLGHLTIEPEWTEFRTLGAKRYVERRKYVEGDPEQDGKLHLTVAGINKEAVTCLNDDIENFRNGCVFDKDEADVSKLLHTYFDNQPPIKFPDGYISDQKRGVNLRPNGYRLTMDKSYDDILQAIGMDMYNEQYEQHTRGLWDQQTIDLEEINDIINDYMERG